jgi:hypothetical protein
MKTLIRHLFLTFLAFACAKPITCEAQVAFTNLNFESANLTPVPAGQFGGEVPVSSALPGWTVYVGNTQQSQVLQNNVYNSTATVDILGPSWEWTYPGIIDGQYTVFIQSGVYGTSPGVNASIAQDGTVPAYAESLQFKAWEIYGPTSTPSVSFGGNNLPVVVLSTGNYSPSGQQYDVYGANIGLYAGQTGQLAFTQVYGEADPAFLLDDITFSTNTVSPEPNIVALTAIGGLLFGARKWFARRC